MVNQTKRLILFKFTGKCVNGYMCLVNACECVCTPKSFLVEMYISIGTGTLNLT